MPKEAKKEKIRLQLCKTYPTLKSLANSNYQNALHLGHFHGQSEKTSLTDGPVRKSAATHIPNGIAACDRLMDAQEVTLSGLTVVFDLQICGQVPDLFISFNRHLLKVFFSGNCVLPI